MDNNTDSKSQLTIARGEYEQIQVIELFNLDGGTLTLNGEPTYRVNYHESDKHLHILFATIGEPTDIFLRDSIPIDLTALTEEDLERRVPFLFDELQRTLQPHMAKNARAHAALITLEGQLPNISYVSVTKALDHSYDPDINDIGATAAFHTTSEGDRHDQVNQIRSAIGDAEYNIDEIEAAIFEIKRDYEQFVKELQALPQLDIVETVVH